VLKFSQIFAIEQQRAASGWRAYGACGRKRASRPVRRGRRFRGDSRRHPGASGDDTALFSSAGGGWRGAIQGRSEKRSRPSPDVGTPDRPAGPASRTGQPRQAQPARSSPAAGEARPGNPRAMPAEWAQRRHGTAIATLNAKAPQGAGLSLSGRAGLPWCIGRA